MSAVIRQLGSRFFIIGVAHVLPSSSAEVRDTILRERPDIVAVELDPIRYAAMLQERKPRLSDVIRAGPNIILLSALLYLTQGKFSRETGMPAGDEMLVAIKHANEVGAQVHFVDQYLGTTLQRLAKMMPLREKIRLVAEMLIGLLPVGKGFDLSGITDEQVVSRILGDFKRISPTATEVLINERDDYMSQRLVELLATGKKIVAVVGAGHVPGIYKKLVGLTSGRWSISLEYKAGV